MPVWSASRRRARICARSRVAVVKSASRGFRRVDREATAARRADRAGHGDLPKRLFARGKQERRYGRVGQGSRCPQTHDRLIRSMARRSAALMPRSGIRWRIADFPRRSRRCRPVPRRAPVPRAVLVTQLLVGAGRHGHPDGCGREAAVDGDVRVRPDRTVRRAERPPLRHAKVAERLVPDGGECRWRRRRAPR